MDPETEWCAVDQKKFLHEILGRYIMLFHVSVFSVFQPFRGKQALSMPAEWWKRDRRR